MPKQTSTRRNMVRIYNKTVARWHSYVIDFTVGWSFGEQQGLTFFSFLCRNGLSSPVTPIEAA
jgi:hypothetical protein